VAEQRCTDLGSNCICSEPLQATSYPESSNDFKNPNDTSSLECSQDGVTGGAITRTADDVVASTDATALAALPSGHSVSRFVRAADNHEGTFMLGHNTSVSSGNARVAARWYIYHTPTFDFAAEGTCINSKIVQLNNGALVDWNGTNFHTYGYTTFSPSEDCCLSGPGPDYGSVSTSEMKGAWWRWEVVLTNRSGPDFRMQMYAENVTDPGGELEIIDIWSANYSSASSDKLYDVNLTPPSLMTQIFSNNHRFSNGNTCRGWIGLSHYMYAAWTTDSGQRIGAASEIEGGGGGGGSEVPLFMDSYRRRH